MQPITVTGHRESKQLMLVLISTISLSGAPHLSAQTNKKLSAKSSNRVCKES